MKKILIIFFLLVSVVAYPTTYYVALTTATPAGNDANAGTILAPWATWQKAFNSANAGDTVFFRGGTYFSTAILEINPENYGGAIGASGTKANPIVYMSYPGEWAIIDCSLQCVGNEPEYNSAISLEYVEYITFKDFEIKSVYQCDSVISGAIGTAYSRNLTFDHLVIHDIAQRAFSMLGGAWLTVHDEGMSGYEAEPYWPTAYDSTYFINCDIYDLCDTLSSRYFPHPGNNADGWKVTYYKGNYVEWRNCRIWNYSDDAVDASPANGATFVFNGNWIMSSNKYSSYDIEGNGLKIASFSEVHNTAIPTGRTIVKNNIALYCKAIAFVNNLFINGTYYTQDSALIYNNTAFRNGTGFWEFSYTGYESDTRFKNNLGYDNDLYYGDPNDFYGSPITSIIESHNTMDFIGGWPGWRMTDTVTVTDADFIGLSGDDTADLTYLVGLFTAARQADGSLPINKPLQLSASSDLINAGTVHVGLGADLTSYSGSAPDIGYAEYNEGDPDPPVEAPLVSTGTPNHTNIRGSRGSGVVTSAGGGTISARGICLSTSTAPDTGDTVFTTTGTTGSFNVTITGLLTNTTYHIRAYATNEAGTSYGSEVDFTTPKQSVAMSGTKVMVSGGNLIIIR